MDVDGFALIVGAGSGIGLETALTFAERGARGVAFADKNFDAAQRAAEESKSLATSKEYRAIPIRVDVVDRAAVKSMVEEVARTFGRLDYAINCAGVPRLKEASLADVAEDEFDLLQEVNCKGLLHCLQEEITVMKAQEPLYAEGRSGKRSLGPGSIVNITSLAAITGSAKSVTYVASKFAARGVIKTAALENRRLGLRINEICPGFTDTPMLRDGLKDTPQVMAQITKAMPLGRVAMVEEIAGVAHFLASPSASFMTGETVVVDAGVSVTVGFEVRVRYDSNESWSCVRMIR